jgi:hypothetical protein
MAVRNSHTRRQRTLYSFRRLNEAYPLPFLFIWFPFPFVGGASAASTVVLCARYENRFNPNGGFPTPKLCRRSEPELEKLGCAESRRDVELPNPVAVGVPEVPMLVGVAQPLSPDRTDTASVSTESG